MIRHDICTPQELKILADISPLTIDDLINFIESKTDKQYLVVEEEFVREICKQLLDNTMYIFDLNRFFTEIWDKIIQSNSLTNIKWKDTLDRFKEKKSG